MKSSSWYRVYWSREGIPSDVSIERGTPYVTAMAVISLVRGSMGYKKYFTDADIRDFEEGIEAVFHDPSSANVRALLFVFNDAHERNNSRLRLHRRRV